MKDIEIFLKEITRTAGDKILEMRGNCKTLHSKNYEGDIVTEADIASHNLIVNAIKDNFPEHGIISEEDKKQTEAEYTWIIDPLDGTRNYAAGMPLFGVFIALVRNKEVIMSAAYMPALNEMYFAKKSMGTMLNGVKIICSEKKELKGSYGCYAAMISNTATLLERLSKFDPNIWVANFGCSIYNTAQVIKGSLDFYYTSGGSFIWDNATPSLLLKEAGCKVTNLEGNEWTLEDLNMVAANPELHKQIIKITKGE